MCTKRAARTLREAFPDPKDWIEGPGGERPMLEPARFSPGFWTFMRYWLAFVAALALAAWLVLR